MNTKITERRAAARDSSHRRAPPGVFGARVSARTPGNGPVRPVDTSEVPETQVSPQRHTNSAKSVVPRL